MLRLLVTNVENMEYNPLTDSYEFALGNGDVIIIHDSNYDRIMNHVSINNKIYEAVVDEHEDDFEERIEYIGFIELL